MEFIKRQIIKVLGPANVFSWQERSLNAVLFFTVVVSSVILFLHLNSHSGLLSTLFTLFNLLVFTVMYVAGRRRPNYRKLIGPYLFFSFIIIIWVWFMGGGITGQVIFYGLSFMGITALLTRGRFRIALLVAITIVAILLTMIDLGAPGLLPMQESIRTQSVNSVAGGMFLAVGLILIVSLVHYDQWERQRQAEEKSNSRERFLSIIAHDLKGSIGQVVSLAEVRNSMNGNSGSKQQKDLDLMILESARSTHKLLENLLCWTRAQSGLLEPLPSRFPLRGLVDTNLGYMEEQMRDKRLGVRNEIGPEIQVFADEDMLGTVVRNLLSNAVKFSRDEGEILLKAREDKGAFQVEFSVGDLGVGMEHENLINLFNIGSDFSREGTRGEPGTGIGLKLCKEFVGMNKGSIRAESKPGEGSVFFVTVPSR